MRTFLLVTDSVHTSAALCDYLDSRLTVDDRVVALGLVGTEAAATPEDRRDRRDALNAVAVRLAGCATVDTDLVAVDTDRPATLRTECVDRGVDELVCAVASSDRADTTLAAAVDTDFLTDLPCPVVLVASVG